MPIDEADDLAAALLRLARSPQGAAQAHNPRAYLLTMARRAAIDQHRKRREQALPPEAVLLAPYPDLARAADAERASRLLHRLPGEQREVVFLFIDRLWESRPLRLGWAVLCAALIAGHAVLSPPEAPAAAPLAAAESAPEDLGISRELLSQAQLERLRRQDPGPERPRLMEMPKERL